MNVTDLIRRGVLTRVEISWPPASYSKATRPSDGSFRGLPSEHVGRAPEPPSPEELQEQKYRERGIEPLREWDH